MDENPYDLDSWNILIRESTIRWVGEMRPFYEQLIFTFPTCGRFWKIYIEQEVSFTINKFE